MLSILEKKLKQRKIEFYKIVGETPKEERFKMVEEFNQNDVPIFLISLKAGGTGLNLVAKSGYGQGASNWSDKKRLGL